MFTRRLAADAPCHCPFAMPSAEETTYLIEVVPATTQDFLARDVDLLVSQIKENLRLSSLKAKSSVGYRNRPSPYQVPSRSWADPSSCEVCAAKGQGRRKRPAREDPYELLQELLREGGLIKEAVKRLQANLGGAEEETRRKPYFYDSEDEPL